MFPFLDTLPPGKKKGQESSKLKHPMAHASTTEMVAELFGQMRTWYLLVSFSLLMCLKQGTKFVTIYAKDKLDACDQDGDMVTPTSHLCFGPIAALPPPLPCRRAREYSEPALVHACCAL